MEEGGLPALVRGIELTAARNGVWNGTFFGLTHAAKQHLVRETTSCLFCCLGLSSQPQPESRSQAHWQAFLVGASSGLVATVLSTPFDVCKTRQQVGHVRPQPMYQALPGLWRAEGFPALFKGLGPRLLRLGPGAGILLLAFEEAQRWF